MWFQSGGELWRDCSRGVRGWVKNVLEDVEVEAVTQEQKGEGRLEEVTEDGEEKAREEV